jgi:hypothetical protein
MDVTGSRVSSSSVASPCSDDDADAAIVCVCSSTRDWLVCAFFDRTDVVSGACANVFFFLRVRPVDGWWDDEVEAAAALVPSCGAVVVAWIARPVCRSMYMTTTMTSMVVVYTLSSCPCDGLMRVPGSAAAVHVAGRLDFNGYSEAELS